MIQRIQSIFLLLAAVAAFGLFALPFASTSATVEASANFADSVYTINDHVGLLILFALAGGLSFLSIFMFKNRKTQLLVGRFSIIASIIGLILAFIVYHNDSEVIPDSVQINDEFGLYLPIIFLIFAMLAQRYITKDEKLVRSADRLR